MCRLITLLLAVVHPILPCKRLDEVLESIVAPNVVSGTNSALHLRESAG